MVRLANRLVATALVGLGLALIAVGVFFGVFGWMNSGAAAGLEALLVTAGFGAAAIAIGLSFFVVARSHAAAWRWRWWLQVLLPLVAIYLAFGLAAEFSVFVGNTLRR